jgi:hypothetical protein
MVIGWLGGSQVKAQICIRLMCRLELSLDGKITFASDIALASAKLGFA